MPIRRGDALVFESEIGRYKGTNLGKEVPVTAAGVNVMARDQRAPFFIDDFAEYMRARRDPLGISLGEMQGTGGSSFVTVALMQDDEWLGNLNLYRDRVDPFDPKLGPVLQAFADQAAIAVANARLFNDLDAALEQQTATSEIMRTISMSPGDIEMTLPVIGRSARRLCDADYVALLFWDGDDGTCLRLARLSRWTVSGRGRVVLPLTRGPVADRHTVVVGIAQWRQLHRAAPGPRS